LSITDTDRDRGRKLARLRRDIPAAEDIRRKLSKQNESFLYTAKLGQPTGFWLIG
jgi:hypothetical protein